MIFLSGVLRGVVAWTSAANAAEAKPGDHIRAGGAVITPAIDVGVEYQTNVYHEETDPQGGVDLRVAPALSVGFETDDNKLTFAAQYELRKQLWVAFDPTQVPAEIAPTFDQAAATAALDRYTDFGADVAANLNRQNIVGFDLSDGISYRNNIVDTEYSASPYMTEFRNALAGDVRFRTGGALEVKVGGLWQYDDYTVPEYFGLASLDPNNHEPFNQRNMYGPTLTAGWSFFPNTAWVIESRYIFVRWQNNEISSVLVDPSDTDGISDPVAKPDSDVLRVQTGLRGRITEKLRTDLLVGYGFANYLDSSLPTTSTAPAVDASGLTGLLLTAQFGYQVKEDSSVAFGYRRDFADVYFTDYMASDFVFLQADTKLDHLSFGARYGIRFERYRGEIARNDVFNRAAFDGRYALAKWAQAGLGVWWMHRWSDQDLVEYDDVGVNALLNFSY